MDRIWDGLAPIKTLHSIQTLNTKNIYEHIHCHGGGGGGGGGKN